MPLVAMQHDGIRLQQAGKKIGRDRHPARRDDDRPDIIQRQPPFRLPVRLAGDETAFPAQNRAVLKNVQDVVAHKFILLPLGEDRLTSDRGKLSSLAFFCQWVN